MKKMENIYYDYYNNSPSYLKTIVDMIPESRLSIEKKLIIGDIYNDYLNHADDLKINEVTTLSGLFKEKLAVTDINTIKEFVGQIYLLFLKEIIFNSINRKEIIETLNGNIKLFVNYYDLYNQNIINDNREYVNMSNQAYRR